MNSHPRNLLVEVTSRCNLNCQMCLRNSLQEEDGDMHPSLYQKLIPVFSGLNKFSIIGLGEPLLHPQIVEMVRAARSSLPADGKIILTTNGVLLYAELIEKLIESGLDTMIVSLDSLSSAAYEEIRIGARFEDLIRNVSLLQQVKKAKKAQKPEIGLEWVMMKDNVKEMLSLLEMAERYGVSTVIVNNLLPPSEALKDEIVYDFHSERNVSLFKETKSKADQSGLDLNSYFKLSSVFSAAVCCDIQAEALLEKKERLVKDLIEHLSNEVSKVKGFINIPALIKRRGEEFERMGEILEKVKQSAEQKGITLLLPRIIPGNNRKCGFVSDDTCFVAWDGEVSPCQQLSHSYVCYHYGRRKVVRRKSFGNVAEKDLLTVWNSPDYRAFRSRVETFDFPHCGDCVFADGCPMINDNEFLNDCFLNEEPCGDCLWSRGILQCG
ncbi:MAG: radical SAM/SPASM family putative metalloenzyme maturase [Proteobacteria bacterium]|nr:radical SAM/SPASM family putative metalloenzyme maturase [Pseudomonadota bacterium]